MPESLKEYKQRVASAGGAAFKEKYQGTDYIKEFARKGVEARKAKKAANESVENS